MNKGVAVLLIIMLAASSLILVESASAQSIPKPSVPEFGLKFANASYTVTDQYTDELRQVDNNTITVTIKNQPFSYFYATTNSTYSIFCDMQIKGHFGSNWTDIFSFSNYLPQSNSTYTEISIDSYYAPNSQIDVRIRSLLGKQTGIVTLSARYTFEPVPIVEVIESSDWSNTQTLTIGADTSTKSPDSSSTITSSNSSDSTTAPEAPSSSTSPDNTREPTTHETSQAIPLTMIAVGVALVLANVCLLVYWKKRRHQSEPSSTISNTRARRKV